MLSGASHRRFGLFTTCRSLSLICSVTYGEQCSPAGSTRLPPAGGSGDLLRAARFKFFPPAIIIMSHPRFQVACTVAKIAAVKNFAEIAGAWDLRV